MKIDAITSRLTRELGLDLDVIGLETVQRAVIDRMKRLQIAPEQFGDFVQRIQSSSEEWNEFVEALLVPETWFFRDSKPFTLTRQLAQSWMVAGLDRPFRVLSVPCSSGEEPYSIAMTFLEAGLSPHRFQITAVDLSRRNLERATTGIYRERSLKLVSPPVRQRYFHETAAGPELVPEIRGLVRFRHGNVLDPGFLTQLGTFELILCRNLLIYLTREARDRIVLSLHDRLVPGGTLIVGHADRLRILESYFQAIDDPAMFAYRKMPNRSLAETPKPRSPLSVSGPSSPAELDPGRSARSHGTLTVARDSVHRIPTQEPRRRDHPGSKLQPREGSSGMPDLASARAHADARRYREAIEICEAMEQQSGPSSGTSFLMGLVRQAEGHLAEAERHYRRTIYLDPDHAEALMALALLARRRQALDEATRLERRAARAASREAIE